MRVTNVVRSTGPKVSPDFNKGDSFVALDEGHEDCNARSVVLGPGMAISLAEEKQRVLPGALVRCFGCLMSYVVTAEEN